MNEENIVFNSEDVQNNKVMGILAYFGILSFVGTLITGLIGLVGLFSIRHCRHCKCLLRRAKETSDYRRHHSLQIINSYHSRPKAVILRDTAFLRKDDRLCQ